MDVFIILTPGFPADESDTTCLPAFQQFALSVQKLYPQLPIIVITFQYPFEKKEYLWNGIRVIALGGSNRPLFRRFIIWIEAYRTLQKLQRETPLLGILSLWLTECALIGKIFSKANKVKHFMWLIGQDAKLSNQYIKRIHPKGHEIIAMSDFLKEEYFKNHKESPLLVAENGIIESSFPPLNAEPRGIDILGVGSLIPLKNYTLFIEIIFEVRKKYPNVKAVIAGIGIEEQNLKKISQKLGLEENLSFVGLVSHSEVFDLMNNSKLFLHTSHYEGNSTVLMEALYNGCIVLSTQPLSDRQTKNLSVLKTKEEFVEEIEKRLNDTHYQVSAVVFNTMDLSAKKIMDLYTR